MKGKDELFLKWHEEIAIESLKENKRLKMKGTRKKEQRTKS